MKVLLAYLAIVQMGAPFSMTDQKISERCVQLGATECEVRKFEIENYTVKGLKNIPSNVDQYELWGLK